MGDKYNQNNMNYYQHFVNYVSQMDPSKCKYFDESGFKLTTAHRNYGHSLVGEKCVEDGRLVDNPNTTLNLTGTVLTLSQLLNTVKACQLFHCMMLTVPLSR
jgi:hypothetical protein